MFGLPTALLIKGFAALALLGALTAAYMGWVHHQRDIGRAEVKAQWDSTNYAASEAARLLAQQRRGTADKASAGHEADRSEISTKFVTIIEKVRHEIEVEKLVYSNVCIAPGGLQQLAEAAAATGFDASAAKPGNPVPTIAPTR